MENLQPLNPPNFTDRIPKVGEEDYITAELENRIKEALLTNDAYLKGKLEELSKKSELDLQTLTEKDSELKELFDSIDRTLTTHSEDSNTHVSLTEKGKWNQAEANQNAFSSVNAGGTVIQSNGKTAQFALLAGTDNVTISGDNAKKQVKISVSGGNADTLGGIDSSGFFRRYDLNQINIDNTPGCWSTDVSVNDGSKGTLPPDVAWCSVRQYVSQGEHFFAQIGQDFNHAKLFYRNRYLPTGTWSDWHFAGDGGDAKTLNGLGLESFFRRYNHATNTSANQAVQTGIHTCDGWTGIPSEAVTIDTQGTIITINYNELGGTIGVNNIWLKQQFISPHNNGSFTRYVYGVNIGPWRKDADETVINRLAHTNFFNYVQNTNLNTLLTTGCYQVGSSIYAKLSLNFPLEGVGGFLKVECQGNVRTQTYYAFAGKSNFVRVFYRHYFKNAETGEIYWSEWDEKISSQNVSNPNLLDNPDFKINQRGQSSYTASGQYTVDRWLHNTVDGFKVSPVADGIQLDTRNVTSSTTKGTLIQYIENYEALLGQTMTISVNLGGKIYTQEVVIPTSAGSTKALSIANKMDVFLYHNGSNRLAFNIRLNNGVNITIKRVKLEVSSCFTPFVPPNPAEELLKCQRYYEKVHTPICRCVFYNGDVFGGAEFKVEKRVIPTVTVTANVVGEAAILPIAEIGYPSPSGFTFARTSRQLSLDCPIYFYYVADAEIY